MLEAKSSDGYEIPAVETGGGLAQRIIFGGWKLVKVRAVVVEFGISFRPATLALQGFSLWGKSKDFNRKVREERPQRTQRNSNSAATEIPVVTGRVHRQGGA
jgi:hypothetical protein